MNVITAPDRLPAVFNNPAIFLGGSIENGRATEWQKDVAATFRLYDVTFLSPRRVKWNPEPSTPELVEQIHWELDALEAADAIVIYLQAGTISPISLLELGLHARSGRLVACCPDDYWRRVNVEITCSRYGVPVFKDLNIAVNLAIQKAIDNKLG